MITQERLKEVLKYNPITGVFTWTDAPRNSKKNGKQAGVIYNNGYRIINIDWQRQTAHRLAFLYMTGSFPAMCVDHINGVKDDNSWKNLRSVSSAENALNQKLNPRNKTGIMGVRYKQKRLKWEACISYEGRQRFIGHFKTLFDAACARKSAEITYSYHENHGRAA